MVSPGKVVSPEKQGSAGLLPPSDSSNSEGMHLRDAELRTRVLHFLADSNMPGLRHLQVAAANGTVTLSGRVRTYYEKQLSQQRCRRVAGVVQLVDNVVVSN